MQQLGVKYHCRLGWILCSLNYPAFINRRHLSQITEKTLGVLKNVRELTGENNALLSISGSAGMGISEACGIPLV
ncbi:MAG: hypothetical protein II047_12070, partial [Bacteroidales bacterium]|nr:hypothetical protein [Bacteroidales bacterium]